VPVGFLIANAQERIDLGGANVIILDLAILRIAYGSAKDVIGWAAYRHGVGHPVQKQKRFVQSIVGEIRRRPVM
jgi:hypothetical protein